MAQEYRAGLAERVAYDRWSSADPSSAGYVLADWEPGDDQVPGWTLHQSRLLRVPGNARLRRSTWIREPGVLNPMLTVDVWTAEDPDAARSLALRILGDFQSPNVALREDAGAGEVAFGDGGGGWTLFVRGNVVVQVLNGGREVVPVDEVADAIDSALRSAAGEEEVR